MYDSFGDGWEGNFFEIDGQTGELSDGSEGEATVCLYPGCYDFAIGGGSFANEVSWEFLDDSDNILASGGAPLSVMICVGGATNEDYSDSYYYDSSEEERQEILEEREEHL